MRYSDQQDRTHLVNFSGRYDDRLEDLKYQLTLYICHFNITNPSVPSYKDFRLGVFRTIIRYVEKLIEAKRFQEAADILQALEAGRPATSANNLIDLARAINITPDEFPEFLGQKIGRNYLAFSMGTYSYLKGQIFRGLGKTNDAIKAFQDSISLGVGEYFDYTPYSKVALLELKAETGTPLADILLEAVGLRAEIDKITSLQGISNSDNGNLLPKAKSEFRQRILFAVIKAYKIAKKYNELRALFAAIAENGTVPPEIKPLLKDVSFDKQSAKEQIFWSYIDEAKSIANENSFEPAKIEDAYQLALKGIQEFELQKNQDALKAVVWLLIKWSGNLSTLKNNTTLISRLLEKAYELAQLIKVPKEEVDALSEITSIYYKYWVTNPSESAFLDKAIDAAKRHAFTGILDQIAWFLVKKAKADQDYSLVEKILSFAEQTTSKSKRADLIKECVRLLLKTNSSNSAYRQNIEKAFEVSKKYNLLDVAAECLEAKSKIDPESAINYAKAQIGLLFVLVLGYAAAKNNSAAAKYIRAAEQMGFNLNLGQKDDSLNNKLWLAGKLEFIGDKAQALKTYKECLAPALTAAQGKATTENVLVLAKIFSKTGWLENEIGDKNAALGYLEKAGYVYQILLNRDFKFGPNEKPINKNISVNALTSGSKEYKDALIDCYKIISLKLKNNPNDALARIRAALFEEIKELLSVTEKATQLIDDNKFEEAIKLLIEDLNERIKKDPPDFALISDELALLLWAYDKAAWENKGVSGVQNAYFIKAASIYSALLGLTFETDVDVSETKDICSFIRTGQNAKNIAIKQQANFSQSALRIKLARAYKNAGEYQKAIEQYKAAISSINDDKERASINIELATVVVSAANAMLAANNFEEANRLITDEYLEKKKKTINDNKSLVKEAEYFDALRQLAWMYIIKAKAYEKINGAGTGSKYFVKAAETTKLLLSANEGILTAAKVTEAELWLSIAGLYQSAAQGDAQYLENSQAAYENVIESTKAGTDELSKTNNAIASCGKSEVLLQQTKSNKALMKNNATQALALLKTTFDTITTLNNPDPAVVLRFLKVLFWALNTLADSLEGAEALKYYSALAVLNRVLFEGADPATFVGAWKNIYEKAQTITEIKIDEVSAFLRASKNMSQNKSIFLSDTALKDTETSLTDLQVGYIGTLVKIECYAEAITAYTQIAASLDTKTNQGKISAAKLHSTMGDVYSYKLEDYDKAEVAYKNALGLIDEAETGPYFTLEDKNDMLTQVYKGLSYIEDKRGNHQKAIDHLNNILKLYDLSVDIISQNPNILARQTNTVKEKLTPVLLLIAQMYNYGIKDADMGICFFSTAEIAANSLPNSDSKSMNLGQAYLGLGEIYRLRLREFDKAAELYNRGILALEGIKTRDAAGKILLSRLYTGYGAALAEQGKFEESFQYFEKAKTELGGISNNKEATELNKQIVDSRRAANQSKPNFFSSISYGGSYVWDTFEGNTEKGWTHSANATIRFDRSWSIEASFNNGLKRDYKTNGTYERLHMDSPMNFSLGVKYSHEAHDFNIRTSLSDELTLVNYKLSSYYWTPDYKNHYFDPITSSGTFLSNKIQLNVAGEYKINFEKTGTQIQLGGQFTAAYLMYSSKSPLQRAQELDKRDFPTGDIEVGHSQKGLERWSFGGEAYAGLSQSFDCGLDLFFKLGGGYEYNPNAITGNGLWPMSGQKLTRAYGLGNLKLRYNFGNDYRDSVFLSVNSKFGWSFNYVYVEAESGYRHIFDSFVLELMFKYSISKDIDNRSMLQTIGPSAIFYF